MAATVSHVAENTHSASDAAQRANTAANDGKQIVTQTMQSIDALYNQVNEASQVIQDLAKHSDEIGNVLDVIRDIACPAARRWSWSVGPSRRPRSR